MDYAAWIAEYTISVDQCITQKVIASNERLARE